jgi:hypothetical protein
MTKVPKNWRSIGKGLLFGTMTGICVGLGGFFLADTPRASGMGPVMFLLVPFCAGFAIAMVTRQPNTNWAAMLLPALITLALLVAFKVEGLLCAVLAFRYLASAFTLALAWGISSDGMLSNVFDIRSLA